MKNQLFVLITVILLSLTSGRIFAEASRVKAVFIADNANSSARGFDNLNGPCNESLKEMTHLLELAFPDRTDLYEITLVDRNRVHAEAIREVFRNLRVDSSETLLVYYCGHGAMSLQEGGAYILPGIGSPMLRTELQSLMAAQRAYGSILVTDACMVKLELSSVPAPGNTADMQRAEATKSEVVRQLLLQNRGFIDLSAASAGEKALFTPSGGFFTRALLSAAERGILLDRDGNGTVSWEEFFNSIKIDVGFSTQGRQHAYAFSLGKENGGARSPQPAEYRPQDPPQQQAVQTLKYVGVVNYLDTDINLVLRFGIHTADGQYIWSNSLTWPVARGGSTRLDVFAGTPLVTDVVEYRVDAADGRSSLAKQVRIAPEGGYVPVKNDLDIYNIEVR